MAVFANYSLVSRKWKAEFDFRISGSGADGMTFMFYKDISKFGKPDRGGALGFTVNGQNVSGYGLEFDTYREDEPDTPHIAIIKDHWKNHLVYQIRSDFLDNNYHNIKIYFDNGKVQIFLDDSQIINFNISNVNYQYAGMGFSAATGQVTNSHIIDNFTLNVNDIKLEYPNGGESFAGGGTMIITWKVSPSIISSISKFELFYSLDGGTSYAHEINKNLSASDRSYTWLVPNLNSSTVKIKIRAKNADNSLLAEDESNQNFIIDSTPPNSFNLYSPTNGTWANTLPTFRWYSSSDDLSGLFKYQLIINNITSADSIPYNYSAYTLTEPLSPGFHLWTIKAIDKANNEKQANQTWTVRVDTTRPSAFSLIAPDNGTWTKNKQPTFSWQGSADTESGIAKYQLYIDNKLFLDNISSNSITIPLYHESITDGEHEWYIVAVDNVNNARRSLETWNIKIDSTPPGGPFKNGLKGRYFSSPGSGSSPSFGNLVLTRLDKEINFDWQHSSPNINKIPNNDFQGKWTGEIFVPTTGTYTFKTYTDDGVRLWVDNSLLINEWHDQVVTYHSANKYLNGNKWYQIIMYYYENETGAIAKLYWKPPDDSEEIIPNHRLRCEIGFDLLAPEHDKWTNNIIPTFRWEETIDGGIGVSKQQLWINNELKIDNIPSNTYSITLDSSLALSHGWHKWFVKAYDLLGNVSNSNSTWTIKIDTRPPSEFQLNSPPNNSFVSFPTPNFSWYSSYDNNSGFSHYQVWIDDRLNADNIKATSTAPGTPISEGYHSWFVKALDKVGNEQKSNETWVVIGEWNLPEPFNLISPANRETIYRRNPTFEWQKSHDTGSGINKYQLWINGVLNRDDIPGSDTTALPVEPLPDGNYNWFVKAIDGAGNSRSSTAIWSFSVHFIDSESPQVTVILPNGGETLYTDETNSIKWEATDNVGLKSVALYYSIDNSISWGKIDSSNILAFSIESFWNIPDTPSNTCLVKVCAYDSSNNLGFDISDSTFTIADRLGPNVDIKSPETAEKLLAGSQDTVRWVAFDNIGVTWQQIKFSSDGRQTWEIFQDITPDDSLFLWTLPLINSSDCWLKILAEDADGNSGSDSTGALIINRPPDIIELPDTTIMEDILYEMTVDVKNIDPGDSLVFSDNTALFDVNPETGEIIFTPLNEHVGNYSISVFVDDGLDFDTTSFNLLAQNVNDPPMAFSLLEPANNALVDTLNPMLIWQESDDIDVGDSIYYRIRVSKDSLFSNILIDTITANLNHTINYGLKKNNKYFWEVYAIDRDSAVTKCNSIYSFKTSEMATGVSHYEKNSEPTNFTLYQNYPNPFNPTTQINFDLPKASEVSIEIYNLRGQKVRTLIDGLMDAGSHSVQFDATDEKGNKLPTGIYLYMLRSEKFRAIKKLAIIK